VETLQNQRVAFQAEELSSCVIVDQAEIPGVETAIPIIHGFAGLALEKAGGS